MQHLLKVMKPYLKYFLKCTYPKDEPGRCFHILGVDATLDSNGIPWILGINTNPSLNIEATSETKRTGEFVVSPIDLHIKSTYV